MVPAPPAGPPSRRYQRIAKRSTQVGVNHAGVTSASVPVSPLFFFRDVVGLGVLLICLYVVPAELPRPFVTLVLNTAFPRLEPVRRAIVVNTIRRTFFSPS